MRTGRGIFFVTDCQCAAVKINCVSRICGVNRGACYGDCAALNISGGGVAYADCRKCACDITALHGEFGAGACYSNQICGIFVDFFAVQIKFAGAVGVF